MGRAADSALLFGPTQAVQAKGRPMVLRFATGIDLFLEAEQTEMPRVVRAEAGDFDVVTEQIRVLRNFVHRAAEELLLVIEARAPGEIRADLQIFAHAMANHIFGVNALS